MPDGRALQSGTSHNLGQNFAKAFDISFQDMDGERRFAWTTSWGLSTRTVGALIMVHGDDGGLIMPPVVAPTQAVILPIWGRKPEERPAIRDAADRLRRELLDAGLRVEVDWSEEKQIGWKHNEWTLKGVPIRIELGPRDIADEQAVLVRRDDPNPRPEKRSVAWSALADELSDDARRDPGEPVRAGGGAADGEDDERGELRRAERDRRGAARLHQRPLVRRAGVRGDGQGEDRRDDPLPAAEGAGRGWALHRRRAAERGTGLVRAGVLIRTLTPALSQRERQPAPLPRARGRAGEGDSPGVTFMADEQLLAHAVDALAQPGELSPELIGALSHLVSTDLDAVAKAWQELSCRTATGDPDPAQPVRAPERRGRTSTRSTASPSPTWSRESDGWRSTRS